MGDDRGHASPHSRSRGTRSLTDPNIEPCAFCQPDTELGVLD
ncbi:DUF6233 domain-containing protein [Streptomyces sp. PTD9-10]